MADRFLDSAIRSRDRFVRDQSCDVWGQSSSALEVIQPANCGMLAGPCLDNNTARFGLTLRFPERNHKNSEFGQACVRNTSIGRKIIAIITKTNEVTAKMGSLTCDLCDTYSLLSLFESDDF